MKKNLQEKIEKLTKCQTTNQNRYSRGHQQILSNITSKQKYILISYSLIIFKNLRSQFCYYLIQILVFSKNKIFQLQMNNRHQFYQRTFFMEKENIIIFQKVLNIRIFDYVIDFTVLFLSRFMNLIFSLTCTIQGFEKVIQNFPLNNLVFIFEEQKIMISKDITQNKYSKIYYTISLSESLRNTNSLINFEFFMGKVFLIHQEIFPQAIMKSKAIQQTLKFLIKSCIWKASCVLSTKRERAQLIIWMLESIVFQYIDQKAQLQQN
ncbi:unnamed protein product [Paramecium primaurelia]|uniref:Uncharacterized protein n=1 Tax=Paramecium primaurelia TaxID=5886 RepID=A0A8S1MUR0_PARPR|nr:unnamed protein product [Paramecium primaurelia]